MRLKNFSKINSKFSSIKNSVKKLISKLRPRDKYTVILLILVVIGSVFALGMQFYISTTETIPQRGGEYREAVVGSPRFINPALSPANDVDRDISTLTYSSLMKYKENGELEPYLAEEYEISDDGETYTFTLRENMVWEDGHPITTDDVAFTIERIKDAQFSSPLQQSWEGVDITQEGDNTIIFELSSPYVPFMENTTVGILPKHVWEDVSPENFTLTDLNLEPIGSGPYKVEKFTRNDEGTITSLTLERNDLYHSRSPYINKITFKFYPTEADAINAYNSNDVDGISSVSPHNIGQITEGVEVHELSMPRYFSIFLNSQENAALEDADVRRALAYATDKEKIIEEILHGYAEKSTSPIPSALEEYYDDGDSERSFDPEHAEELLEEAGWEKDNSVFTKEEDDEELTLEFTLITVESEELEDVANEISSQWEDIGIILNVETRNINEVQQTIIRSRSYEMLLFGHILGINPDPYSFWHSSQKEDPGLNLSNYENESVDEILSDIRIEDDDNDRIQQVKEFQELLTNDAPAIFLYEPYHLHAVRRSIHGISDDKLMIDASFRFLDVSNWYIETRRVF